MTNLNIPFAQNCGFSLIYYGKELRITKTYFNQKLEAFNVSMVIDQDNNNTKHEYFKLDINKGKLLGMTIIKNIPASIKNQLENDIKIIFSDKKNLKILK